MAWEFRENLTALSQFLRTASLARSVLGLMSLAFVLLLIVNIATFVMIGRTSDYNEAVDRSHRVQIAVRDLEKRLIDAQTAQRSFLISSDPQFLDAHAEALNDLPALMASLVSLTDSDPAISEHVARIRELTIQRISLSETTVQLARDGRTGDAVAIVSSGRGKALMDAIGDEIRIIDQTENELWVSRRARSEWSARATVGVNALAAVLILMLAGIVGWLMLRSIRDMQAAQFELDRINANLENEVRDRTGELVKANAEIRLARDRAEAMLGEVNHRVGNSLQLVSSFISLQMRQLKGSASREALREAQTRIEAVAHVHRRLYTSGNMSEVDMDEYLKSLIAELNVSMGEADATPTLVLDVDPMKVSTDQAVSLGVIVTELVTNAVKYAYAPDKGGEIRVHLKADGEARAILTVEDDGPGMGDTSKGPKGTGLGSKIVAAMAGGLRSKVHFDDKHQGVRAQLAFDL